MLPVVPAAASSPPATTAGFVLLPPAAAAGLPAFASYRPPPPRVQPLQQSLRPHDATPGLKPAARVAAAPMLAFCHHRVRPTTVRLHSERPRPSSGSVSADGKAQKASFYKRPSKAIEMGGGFFIPGLEGYRLRLATALLVFALLVLNRFPGYDPSQSQLTSEAIGVGAAVILLAQALVEKAITDAASRPDEDEDYEVVAASSDALASNAARKAGVGGGSGGIVEECPGITEASAEDDARWAGYALFENLGAPAVALLHQDKGLLYRRLPAARAQQGAGAGAGLVKEAGQALAQTLPKSVRRAYGMGDALAPWGGAGGSVAKGLAEALGLPQAEGVVVVRVGDKAVLAVAPPPGGVMREQAVWVERAAALLEQAGLGQ